VNTMKFRSIGMAMFVLTISMFGFAQQGRTADKVAHTEHSEAMQACAKACSDCQRACDTCATHCAHMLAEGKKEHLTTLATCLDCSTICAAASQVVARGGPFSNTVCTACADCCARCATQCEKFPEDKHMKACAEECRKCEKACRDMLKHASK